MKPRQRVRQDVPVAGESLCNTSDRGRLLQELRDVAESCVEDDWDGGGALRVSPEAVRHAMRLIELLPASSPLPNCDADPDGEICFDWPLETRRVFSVSMSPNGVLSYAGLFERAKLKGRVILDDRMPAEIMHCLNRLFEDPH